MPMPRIFFLFAVLSGLFQSAVNTIDQNTLKNFLESNAPFDFILIDVREASEITTAIGNDACKPYNLAWPERFKILSLKIPKDFPIIIYCQTGGRAQRAAEFLASAGYTHVYSAGGVISWNGPVIPPSEIKPVSLLPEPSMRAVEKRARGGAKFKIRDSKLETRVFAY
jgi:phage shock protein E